VLASEIERLPDLERKVLMLYYQRDLAPHEIAQIIQIKATRVSQIRCQAIARLRANLKKRLAGASKRS
jgi:RNA polymerase sigma factor for flagellar operon FliA